MWIHIRRIHVARGKLYNKLKDTADVAHDCEKQKQLLWNGRKDCCHVMF